MKKWRRDSGLTVGRSGSVSLSRRTKFASACILSKVKSLDTFPAHLYPHLMLSFLDPHSLSCLSKHLLRRFISLISKLEVKTRQRDGSAAGQSSSGILLHLHQSSHLQLSTRNISDPFSFASNRGRTPPCDGSSCTFPRPAYAHRTPSPVIVTITPPLSPPSYSPHDEECREVRDCCSPPTLAGGSDRFGT